MTEVNLPDDNLDNEPDPEVPEEEEVAEGDTMTKQEADADDTVDNEEHEDE